jgi:hypothetical protein
MKLLYIFISVLVLSISVNAQDKHHGDKKHGDKKHDSNTCDCAKWKFEFTAGAWNTAVGGDVTANSLPGNIYLPLKDKFDGADFSFLADFEMSKGVIKIIGQFTSLNQTGDGTFVNSIYQKSHSTIRPLYVVGGIAFDFYSDKALQLDLLAGVRWNFIRNQVQTTYVNGVVQSETEKRGYIDPLVGGRFYYTPFTHRGWKNLYFKGYMDIGGLGLVSKLAFQAYLAAGYSLNETFSLRLGYRYFDDHYVKGNFLYDVGFQGFEFGATTRF